MNAARVVACAGALLVAVLPSVASAEAPAASSEPADVLADVEPVGAPVRTFLPKYKAELFLVAGYQGTFSSWKRQWPALTLGFDALLLRPGRFDFGIYVDWQIGRADEPLGRFSSAAGLEIMWRVLEDSFWDLAPLVRGAYVLDWESPSDPLFRPGVGIHASLLRFVAIQATFDVLIASSRAFSSGDHALLGFSIALKMGFAPLFDRWPQYREAPTPIIDRSRVTCEHAARTCLQAARGNARDELCAATMAALDTSRHTAGWNDPTGAFLDALQREAADGTAQAVRDELSALAREHRSSVRALAAYAQKQRELGESEMLSKRYQYLVTPVMIRDWLGCDADGRACRTGDGTVLLSCPTEHVCARDTGVSDP